VRRRIAIARDSGVTRDQELQQFDDSIGLDVQAHMRGIVNYIYDSPKATQSMIWTEGFNSCIAQIPNR